MIYSAYDTIYLSSNVRLLLICKKNFFIRPEPLSATSKLSTFRISKLERMKRSNLFKSKEISTYLSD